MSNLYSQDNGQGSPPQGFSYAGRTSRSHSLQPDRDSSDTRASRSPSSNRPMVPGQAYDTYAVGQHQEYPPAGPYPYGYPQQSQIQHGSNQQQQAYYQPADYPRPAGPPPSQISPSNQTRHSPPEQSHTLYSSSYSTYTQRGQYQHRDLDHPARNLQQQQHSPPQNLQQPSPPRYQTAFTVPSGDAATSFGSNVPGEYHGRNATRVDFSYSTPTHDSIPTCRYPNCYHSVITDDRTGGLSEYCSPDHMRDHIRLMQQPQQYQQYYSSSAVRPSSLAPSGSVTWNSARGESFPIGNHEVDYQSLSPGSAPVIGGHVRCSRCGATYSPRSRSDHVYGTEPGNPVGYGSMALCSRCSRAT
ncbi:hypothetical protein BJV74DRAFT_282420 [Russula compacta]|nr:hypothetical protein BJV74DRAFT_282420 [Russula compacta]